MEWEGEGYRSFARSSVRKDRAHFLRQESPEWGTIIPAMSTVIVSGKKRVPTNTFWIAANIIFELGTGQTKEVLMLVNRVEDATVFTELDASNYYVFVTTRSKGISWSIEPAMSPPGMSPLSALLAAANPHPPVGNRFVIKGVQHVG